MYNENTASMWLADPRRRAQVVRRVCDSLQRCYGLPRFGNPTRPIDDLVYIVLSNRTSPDMARAVYVRLKRLVGRWEEMPAISLRAIRSVLKPAGLSNIKAIQLRGAVAKIVRDFGHRDLRTMRSWPESEI